MKYCLACGSAIDDDGLCTNQNCILRKRALAKLQAASAAEKAKQDAEKAQDAARKAAQDAYNAQEDARKKALDALTEQQALERDTAEIALLAAR